MANRLDTVRRELAVLESSAARARQQIDNYDRSLRIAPEVEREYSQLLREYDIDRERFRDIETSLRGAALGQELESEARGVLGSRSIKWNFTKFLVSRTGEVLQRFGSTTRPKQLAAQISQALAEK